MQEPRQKTAATQPYPIGDAIVPQSIDIPPEGSSVIPSGATVVNDGKIFTPFWNDPIAVSPARWVGRTGPPSSYDPESHLLYVCASDRINSFSVQESLNTPVANQVYMGGRFVQANADDRGILAALDVRTNKLAWRQQWREICYSGSVVTAAGCCSSAATTAGSRARQGERQVALGVQTDAGVNTTVTTFEWKGEQRVVVHAGGGVFAGATRGDGIWMFAPSGTMKSLPVGRAPDPSGRRRRSRRSGASAARLTCRLITAVERGPRPPAVRRGVRRVPRRGGDGGTAAARHSSRGKPRTRFSRSQRLARTRCRRFGRVYSDADLKDVAGYISDVLAKNRLE
jgi:alcohol dehydrogenase (cytochrome c)